MTVMTGGRLRIDSSSSLIRVFSNFFCNSISCSSPGLTSRTSAPISAAKSSIMSSVSDCVAVTISPCSIRNLTRSAVFRFSFGATSIEDEARSMTTSPSGTGASSGVYAGVSIGCSSSCRLRLLPFFFLWGR